MAQNPILNTYASLEPLLASTTTPPYCNYWLDNNWIISFYTIFLQNQDWSGMQSCLSLFPIALIVLLKSPGLTRVNSLPQLLFGHFFITRFIKEKRNYKLPLHCKGLTNFCSVLGVSLCMSHKSDFSKKWYFNWYLFLFKEIRVRRYLLSCGMIFITVTLIFTMSYEINEPSLIKVPGVPHRWFLKCTI